MVLHTDISDRFYRIFTWYIGMSIQFLKIKVSFIFVVLLCMYLNASAQCPEAYFFKEKIRLFDRAEGKDFNKQLRNLLNLETEMKKCDFENDSSFMYLQQKIGSVYFKIEKYGNALYYTNRSVNIAKRLLLSNGCQPLALVDNYYMLYYIFNILGQEENKYRAVDSCIVYFVKGESGYEKALYVLLKKVDFLFNKGDYNLCIENAKLGEGIVEKYLHGKDSIDYIASFVTKRANALYFASQIFDEKKLLESKILQFRQGGHNNYIATFYTLLGLAGRLQERYLEALVFFRKALEINASIQYNPGRAQNLAFIGGIEGVKLKHFNEGLKYLSASLKYADAGDSFYVLRQEGAIYSLKNSYGKAQNFFQKAYNIVHQGMDENTLLQTAFQFPGFNQLQNLSDLTTDKGDAFVRQYYFTKDDSFLKKAICVYKKNDLFLAKIKTEQNLQIASSLVWSNTARSLYEHAIDACYADNNIKDAFYFFEKSRAILLNDQVNEQRWMADADIANQTVLKKNIIDLNLKLNSTTPSSDEYLKIQKELYLKNQQLDILTDSIKNKNPLYYKNYLDTSFISVSQLRKNILGNSKSLVEIFSGDSAVYVLTITGNNQSLIKINKQLYDSVATSFNLFISNPVRLNKDFRGWVKTSHQLYALIFQNNILPDGSIIISPDGINFPFEVLVLGSKQEPDYFLNHYAVSYTYSAKYLTNRFDMNTNSSNTIFGMAPVQYKSYLNLAPLAGSVHSLNKIDNYFSHAANYILEKATKNNFLQNFPDYNIVQLYTHAFDSSGSNDPVIYFSDSALYLSSLLPDRKPVTQLVVLSACETANGKFYQGEGIFSFNRGFAALGIPAAISNLWSVENESTYQITELFYKYLSKGLPTDVALQKAKLEFINRSFSKEKKLPYYWAGAILTGKVDIFKSHHSLPWLEITILLIVLSGVTFLIKKFLLHRL